MAAKTIDICDAKAWAKKWQDENKTHAKAFLIPVEDLIACLTEMDVLVKQTDGHFVVKNVTDSGIRAYMAIKRPVGDPPSAETEKLLIVGTSKQSNGKHKDLIVDAVCDEQGSSKAAAIDGSGVYDFTEPCPNECDTNSPLYNP